MTDSRIIISSCLATCIAELVTIPICTAKTNYQNTSLSIYQSIERIAKREGKYSFTLCYRSSLPAILSQMLSTTSKYYLYIVLQRQDMVENKFLLGMTSGVLSTLFTHPIDVVKIYMQMGTCFTEAFRREGFKILYRGYSKTVQKAAIGSSLYFPLYDYSKEILENPTLSALTASFLSICVTHPFDHMKTRRMYGINSPNISGLYRGFCLNAMRVIPHFTITMYFIDKLSK